MKKAKNHNLIKLTELYINYIFQRATIIVLISSLILMSIILFLMSNPNLDLVTYQEASNEIHDNYLKQSFFIISLFNGIINVAMVITITTNSEGFDKLFISYTERSRICISKILAYTISLILIILIEVFILYIVPLVRYPNYMIDINILKSFLFLFIQVMLEFSISLVFVTIITNIFIPMMVMFIFVCIRIISNNYSNLLSDVCQYFPVIQVENGIVSMDSIYFIPICLIFILFAYKMIYDIKDL